ncbi:amidase [Chloroflexota bacterium]
MKNKEVQMDNMEICRMSALEMRNAIRAKKLSPVELMDAFLQRIERINPKVNAYCTVVAESARTEARCAEDKLMKGEELGPLHGIPVSVKDLVFTKGIRTTGGTRMYENFIPDEDDIVVERLKAAGAIVIGKTNTPQSGWVAITDNLLFGPTRNPWNTERVSGGSSGGAASAVASCMGPLAIGSDGGGSIRIPSSFCGVFGLKPSWGRVPHGPGFPGIWEGLSVVGPITRTVKDAALMMEVIAGRDDRDHFSLPDVELQYLSHLGENLKGLRIAWSSDLGYAIADPQVIEVTEAAARIFNTLGCTVEAVNPQLGSPEETFSIVVGASLAAVLVDKLDEWRDHFEPALVTFLEKSKDISAMEYIKARINNLEYRNRVQAFFEKYDLLLTPTVAVPPFKVGRYGPREIAGTRVTPLGWMSFTYPFNITGQPAASVPCGWTDDGLPVGLQIVGRRFDEITVLQAAAAFEQASPWADRIPPLE